MIMGLAFGPAYLPNAWAADVTIKGKIVVEGGKIDVVKWVRVTPVGGEPETVPVLPTGPSTGGYEATLDAEGLLEVELLGLYTLWMCNQLKHQSLPHRKRDF